MRYFILTLSLLAGFAVSAAEQQDPEATRIREEEQKKIREANEATAPNKDGTRQAERTANQNPSDAAKERTPLNSVDTHAVGRTPPAAADSTGAQRDADMRARDNKQAQAIAERETLRQQGTPKAQSDRVQRDFQQQNVFDQRENATQSEEQKRKAEASRQGR